MSYSARIFFRTRTQLREWSVLVEATGDDEAFAAARRALKKHSRKVVRIDRIELRSAPPQAGKPALLREDGTREWR